MFKLSENIEFIKQFCNDEKQIGFYYSLFMDNQIIVTKNVENFVSYLMDNLYEKDSNSNKLLKAIGEPCFPEDEIKFLNRENDKLVYSIISDVLFRNVSLKYIEIYMRNYDGDLEKIINYINTKIHSTEENIFLHYPRPLRLSLLDKMKNEKIRNKIRSAVDFDDIKHIQTTLECQKCFSEENREDIMICKDYHTFCKSCVFMKNSKNKCLNVSCYQTLSDF